MGYDYIMNSNENHTFDQASVHFLNGREDGYMGYSRHMTDNEDYDAGYAAGVQAYNDDVAEADAYDYGADDVWNPVEQGMYDDDPNPYFGTY